MPKGKARASMRLITLHLPESYLRALDELVRQGYYPSRAEAIRVAIRDMLNREGWPTTPSP